MEPVAWIVLILCLTQVPSVVADSSHADIIGMAVAGTIGFILLVVVLAIIVVALQWKDCFNQWMRRRGKVPMSKSYFRKKKEANRRLISASSVPRLSEVNGRTPTHNIYDTVTSVNDWPERSERLPPPRIYEEKDATVEFGEENDDNPNDETSGEYTIETEVIETEEPEHDGSAKRDHTDAISDNDVNSYLDVKYLKLTDPLQVKNVAEPWGKPTEALTEPLADYSSDIGIKVTSFN